MIRYVSPIIQTTNKKAAITALVFTIIAALSICLYVVIDMMGIGKNQYSYPNEGYVRKVDSLGNSKVMPLSSVKDIWNPAMVVNIVSEPEYKYDAVKVESPDGERYWLETSGVFTETYFSQAAVGLQSGYKMYPAFSEEVPRAQIVTGGVPCTCGCGDLEENCDDSCM